MNPSDTPKTDAALASVHGGRTLDGADSVTADEDFQDKFLSLARQLERDNNQLRQQLAAEKTLRGMYFEQRNDLEDKLKIEQMRERCTKCSGEWHPSLVESSWCIFCILKERNQQLTEALAQNVVMREALEAIKPILETDEADSLECQCATHEHGCERCDYFTKKQNIVNQALSPNCSAPLLEVVKEMKEALQIINADLHYLNVDWMKQEGHDEAAKVIGSMRERAQQALTKAKEIGL